MISLRGNLVLFAILLALVGLDLGLRLVRPEPREIARLFPELWKDRAHLLRIEARGSGAPPIEIRRAAGGWVLPGQAGVAARGARVAALLEQLIGLTDVDRVADEPERHDEYGVGQGGTLVRVLDEQGQPLATLVQGREAPGAPGETAPATWVRPLGADAVYRAARLAPIGVEPLDWMENRWLDFEPEAVRSLVLTRGESTPALELSLGRDGSWSSADGRSVSKVVVRELLTHARGLFFDAVEEAGSGPLEPAELVLELELDGGRLIRAAFGAADEQGARWSWREDREWRARFSESMVAPLLRRVDGIAERLR